MIKTKHDTAESFEMKIVFARWNSASCCFLRVFLFFKHFWIRLLISWIQFRSGWYQGCNLKEIKAKVALVLNPLKIQ